MASIIYGVKGINGKLIATIYPDVKSVPKDENVVLEEELADYTEKFYNGK